MSETHPYFIAKAREVLRKAEGNPDNCAALAAWAEDARKINDCDRGVIVAEDGEIVAATRYQRGLPSATYVEPDDAMRYGLFGCELGLALGQLKRATGKELIHVKMSQVCLGASQFIERD